ncbi:helix-turn-helix domain-containing protein [Streptomyces synnematoformans]|uniref:Helix-turn-helix domain-containing protein n=2 Tax=Streptomyces synnematoformans TaxID=415721 RepID=A0ABP5J7T4_9ACTN
MAAMKQARHPERDEITFIAVVGAFCDPIRIGLVRVLADGRERGWGELRAPVAKSTLSHHLRVLRDAGVTRTRQEGTRCFVELRRDDLDARFPGLLDAVLAAAGSDDTGAHVGLADDAPAAGPEACHPSTQHIDGR